MDFRLAVVFAALLLSTAAGMLHIMFSSAQTENILMPAHFYVPIPGIPGTPVCVQRIYKKKPIFSHAIVVLCVPAIR